MLQEAYHWSQERQERWQKTRKRGCLSYVMRTTTMALLAAILVSALYCGSTLIGNGAFELSTALTIPVLGLISGLIIGRTYWGLNESSFHRMEAR